MNFNPKSAQARKHITNDYEIVVEVKNRSMWVVWVLNSHEALLGQPSACTFAYAPSRNDARNDARHASQSHTYMVATDRDKLERCVEAARDWIQDMHKAKMEAQSILESTDAVSGPDAPSE